MDYIRPIAAIVPGVQGKILTVLAATEAPLTMRTAARLADVSVNQAATVLNRLIELGLVERRDAGTAALVRLVRDNEAARAVIALSELRERVIARLAVEAASIQPAPAAVVLFGSFVRGSADADSDLDVLVVRPENTKEDDVGWSDTLAQWQAAATRAAGSPVNMIQVATEELADLLAKPRSVWVEIVRDGRLVVGSALETLAVRPRSRQ